MLFHVKIEYANDTQNTYQTDHMLSHKASLNKF